MVEKRLRPRPAAKFGNILGLLSTATANHRLLVGVLGQLVWQNKD